MKKKYKKRIKQLEKSVESILIIEMNNKDKYKSILDKVLELEIKGEENE